MRPGGWLVYLALTMLLTPPAQGGPAEECASLDPQGSIMGCSLIIENGPTRQVDTAMAYVNRGRAYLMLRQLEKALSDLNESIRLRSNYAAAYSHRGHVYLAEGLDDAAMADYTRAIELDP